MSEKILIGKAKAKNDKEEIIELKIYLGNVVELPDGTLTSLREDTYKKILQQWESEHISIVPPDSPKMENSETPEDTTSEMEAITEAIPGIDEPSSEMAAEENVQITEDFTDEKDITINTDTAESKNTEHTNTTPVKKEKANKKHLIINIIIIILVIVATYLATPHISTYIENYSSDISTTQPSPTPENSSDITIVRSITDISQGKVITEDMVTSYTISSEEYEQLNNAVYVSSDGSTSNGSLVLSEKIDTVIGKFATRNISKGTYITTQDISTQKIIAEKTFIEVEVDGQTVSVPVDSDYLAGDTRVKIVALITTENNNETIAVALSEFILEDRTLQDIFDSAGQSILDKLSGQ